MFGKSRHSGNTSTHRTRSSTSAHYTGYQTHTTAVLRPFQHTSSQNEHGSQSCASWLTNVCLVPLNSINIVILSVLAVVQTALNSLTKFVDPLRCFRDELELPVHDDVESQRPGTISALKVVTEMKRKTKTKNHWHPRKLPSVHATSFCLP
jgi:hypothetical protein